MKSHPRIQIVDENDQPIGGAGMHEAYDNGLIHRVAYVFIKDPAGNILLQKRSQNVANYTGCWDISAAGHVDEGEDYLQAIEREIKEELGLADIDPRQINRIREDEIYKGKLLKRFKGIFHAEIPNDTVFNPDPEEVSDLRWTDLTSLQQQIANHPDQYASGLTLSLKYLPK